MFAILESGIVVDISEEVDGTRQVVDITDLDPMPGIGWKLDGSVLNDGSLDCKIYDYLNQIPKDKKTPPHDVDFLTGLTVKLHRKQTMVKGEVQVEQYFLNFNGTSYSDEVVKETHSFARDVFGFAKYRSTTVEWFLKCNKVAPNKKIWVKHYDMLQSIEEGIQRRGNIVKFLQPKILGILQMTVAQQDLPNIIIWGRSFLSRMKDHFDNFVDHSDRSLYSALQDEQLLADFPWLLNNVPGTNISIVQFILSEVTI
jgi:hypothetical protein